MEIWQIICLTALGLTAILMVILIRNLRMMKEIWEEKEEEFECPEKKSSPLWAASR